MSASHPLRALKRSLAALIVAMTCGALPADAKDMTAGSIITEMEPEARFPYLSGIVEGLAYARYKSDGNKTEGMACIYEWFYRGEKSANTIYGAFAKFKDHTPGAVMAALIKQRCGE